MLPGSEPTSLSTSKVARLSVSAELRCKKAFEQQTSSEGFGRQVIVSSRFPTYGLKYAEGVILNSLGSAAQRRHPRAKRQERSTLKGLNKPGLKDNDL
jgi:hypothetical protein